MTKVKISTKRRYQIEVIELKNTITELKKYYRGVQQWTGEAEDGTVNSGQRNSSNQRNKKKNKSEDSLRDSWDIKGTNIHIIEVSEGEERQKGAENLFE